MRSGDGPADRLTAALADLRLQVLRRCAQCLGLPAEAAAIAKKMPKMSDQEILDWLQKVAEAKSKPRGFWRRFLGFWPFR